MIYPVFEPYTIVLAEDGYRLPQDRIYATPDRDTVLTTLDKNTMAERARQAGVPTAPFETVDTYEDLLRAADDIGFPLVVRPQISGEGVAGKKALICHHIRELTTHLPRWPQAHPTLMVQRYVSGPRHNHYYAARRGKLFRLLETRITQTELIDGTGLAVEGETVAISADLRAHTERLIRALDYTGVGLTQYMVDRSSGEVTFVELNPRIVGSHVIAEAMGMELSRLAIDLAETPDRTYALKLGAAGTRYAWTYGALRGLRSALGSGELGLGGAIAALVRIVRVALTAKVHMTWAWSDPLPTLMLFAHQIPGLRRLKLPAPWCRQLDHPNRGPIGG